MSRFRRLVGYLLNPRARYVHAMSTAVAASDAFDDEELAMPRMRPRQLFNMPLVVGSVILLLLLLVILFGPLWSRTNAFVTSLSILPSYDVDSGITVKPPLAPSLAFPLGTDAWGNDMLSLLFYGARVTLIAGALITFFRVLLGTVIGSVAGWFKGRMLDQVIMVVISIVASLPMLLSSMILVLALDIENGISVFIVALTLIGWTETAQYVRGEMQVIQKMNYIEGAEAVGLSNLQIVVRHALPNLLPYLLVFSFLEMGAVLFLMAELGFLGIFIGGGSFFALDPIFGRGAVPLVEVPEWGLLLGIGAPSLRSAPHLVWGPALAFALAIFGLNATGEGLRRLLDKSAVSTNFLLRRRMLLVLLGAIGVIWLVLRVTGPELSYAQAARAFDGARAAADVATLATLTPEETAVTIADIYRENDLVRGYRIGVNSFYEYQPEGAAYPSLIGFRTGFDVELGSDLIVLFTQYPAATGSPAASAVLLETVRLWNEQMVDPRRSVLFVVWGDSLEAAQAYLTDPANFTKLPVPNRDGITTGPAAVIQLDAPGGPAIWLSPSADPLLQAQITAVAGDIPIRTGPDILLPTTPAAGSGAVLSADQLQELGEDLTRKLLPIVREDTP